MICPNMPCAMAESGLIPGLLSANQRQRYFVTMSLIGWAQAQNQPWECIDHKITVAKAVYQFFSSLLAWAGCDITSNNLLKWYFLKKKSSDVEILAIKYRMVYGLPWITIVSSSVWWFANNFLVWHSHEWKFWVNHLMGNQKVAIHGKLYIILFLICFFWCSTQRKIHESSQPIDHHAIVVCECLFVSLESADLCFTLVAALESAKSLA